MLLHVQHATTFIINVLVAIHLVVNSTRRIIDITEVNSTRRIIDITKIVDQWMKYLTHFSLLHLYAP